MYFESSAILNIGSRLSRSREAAATSFFRSSLNDCFQSASAMDAFDIFVARFADHAHTVQVELGMILDLVMPCDARLADADDAIKPEHLLTVYQPGRVRGYRHAREPDVVVTQEIDRHKSLGRQI